MSKIKPTEKNCICLLVFNKWEIIFEKKEIVKKKRQKKLGDKHNTNTHTYTNNKYDLDW